MESNDQWAEALLKILQQYGVAEFCVCAGARNAPLIKALNRVASEEMCHFFFDERSAAFFALGRIRAIHRPVAILTTSGTAVAELLPATIEAYYSGDPLVLVTADRPKKFRATGAPQSIEQAGLFGSYVSFCQDLEFPQLPEPSELAAISPSLKSLPCHFNICFDEPLLGPPADSQSGLSHDWTQREGFNHEPCLQKSPYSGGATFKTSSPFVTKDIGKTWNQFSTVCKSPLILVGGLRPGDIEPVQSLLDELQWPTYAEATSGLRAEVHASPWGIRQDERWITCQVRSGQWDGILRIGSVPTSKVWRRLEKEWEHLPVLSVSHRPFPGLARPSHLIYVANTGYRLLQDEVELRRHRANDLHTNEKERQTYRSHIDSLLEKYPHSEPAWFRWLSLQIRPSSFLYLGNSLPIRYWDAFADSQSCHHVGASRGANGIDGQVSTFLGQAYQQSDAWAILGDLTALYDLNALWAWRGRSGEQRCAIVIMNNGGGKIFERLFKDPHFENQHDYHLQHWAALWRWDYRLLHQNAEGLNLTSNTILEVCPDPLQTDCFWEEYDKIKV